MIPLELYRQMVRIRRIEEMIAKLYPEQEMRCPTHLSIGQEAVAAGVCAALQKNDAIFLNHRCHAGYLAKGGDLRKMMAELYGKETGCTNGRGGSMHLVDPEAGILGTSALVAGTIPIACGAALSFQRRKTKQVAVAFFGDAAVEEGTFFESVNMAALWKLPVLFICENNGYSTATPLSKRQVAGPICNRVKPFIPHSIRIDGNDVATVFRNAVRAVQRARMGRGPSFIECMSYRWMEHVGPHFDWDLGYRTRKEVESWMKRCPIKRYETQLMKSGKLSRSKQQQLYIEIDAEIEAAVRFAKDSPFPTTTPMEESPIYA